MQQFWVSDCVEKNRMCLSAVPPPEARVEGLLGHQPMAFTAALCSWNFTSSLLPFCEYTTNLLSLPPEAMQLPSGLHLSPHISWVCALQRLTMPDRRSQVATAPSRDPLARSPLDQSRLPTRPQWASNWLTFLRLAMSKTLICPLLLPMAILLSSQKETEQMQSLMWLVSQSRLISEEHPDQRYREESRATAIWLLSDHASRFRQKSSCRLGASRILQGFLPILRVFFSEPSAFLKDLVRSVLPVSLLERGLVLPLKDMILWLGWRSTSSRMPLPSSCSQLVVAESRMGLLQSIWKAQERISLGMKRSPRDSPCRFYLFFSIKLQIKFYLVFPLYPIPTPTIHVPSSTTLSRSSYHRNNSTVIDNPTIPYWIALMEKQGWLGLACWWLSGCEWR